MGYEIPALVVGLIIGSLLVYMALNSRSASRALAEAGRLATQMFEAQRSRLEESIRKSYDSVYEARFAEWKVTALAEEIKTNRADAVDTSRAVMKGKIAEQMAPMISEFQKNYNPADARFIGSPIDYLIFNNMSKGMDCEEPIDIVLLDIKTGKAGLTPLQKKIEAAAKAKRIEFRVLRFETPEAKPTEEPFPINAIPIESLPIRSGPANSVEIAPRKNPIV